MSEIKEVEKLLEELGDKHQFDQTPENQEAERLAELYKDIMPEPYAVPIERYIGTAFASEKLAK